MLIWNTTDPGQPAAFDDGTTESHAAHQALLDYLKEAIVQNLAVYSVLIDISSYFIEQNSFLVLARLRERDSEGRRYEIKFYTHSPKELLTHYEDKIYIGRDFIDLYTFNRKYFGVKEDIISLNDASTVQVCDSKDFTEAPLPEEKEALISSLALIS